MLSRGPSRIGVSCLLALTLGCGGAQQVPPAATASPAPVTHDTLASDVDAYITAIGRHWGPEYAFTGHVSIVRDGEVVLQKAYGQSDRERGIVANVDTRFRIGSLTKQFTAVSVMQLVEQKKLRLDASIRTYLPELPETFGAVTLHHLLSHTSGIHNYTDLKELAAAGPDHHYKAADVLAAFIHRPLAFAAGTGFEYSNSNYFLLGLAIEKASGVTYETYLQTHVLGPAGMARTSTFDAPDAPNTAVGYRLQRERLVPASHPNASLAYAAGALRSTPKDMLTWARALNGDKLLSAASKQRLFTPNLDGYGYGFIVDRDAGTEVRSHTGGIHGFTSSLTHVPAKKLHILVLGNNESFDHYIGGAILQMALTGKKLPAPEERVPLRVPAELAARITGLYAITDASRAALTDAASADMATSIATLTVTLEGERVWFATADQPAELFASPEGQLFTKRGLVLVDPEPPTGTAPADALKLRDTGLTLRFVRKIDGERDVTP